MVHTTERSSKLSVPLEEVTVHNPGISLLLLTSAWVLLSPPRLDRWLDVPVHRQCGERRSPKVLNPQPGGVLNPEPSAWPLEILLTVTVPTLHTLILLVT